MNFDLDRYFKMKTNDFEAKILLDGEVLPYWQNARVSQVCRFPDICTRQIGFNTRSELRKVKPVDAVKQVMRNDIGRGKERLRALDGIIKDMTEKLPQMTGAAKKLFEEELVEMNARRGRITDRVQEIPKEIQEVHNVQKRSATVLNRGTTIHTAKREEQKAVVLPGFFVMDFEGEDSVRNLNRFVKGWTEYGNGHIFEFPLYGRYKGMRISGHPDYFELNKDGVTLLEEWKPDPTFEGAWTTYFKQGGLYEWLLANLMGNGFPTHIVTYDKTQFDKSALQKIRTGASQLSVPEKRRVVVKNVNVEESLEAAYMFFTAQTPCEPFPTALCQWCNWKHKCDSFCGQGGSVTEEADGSTIINFKAGRSVENFN